MAEQKSLLDDLQSDLEARESALAERLKQAEQAGKQKQAAAGDLEKKQQELTKLRAEIEGRQQTLASREEDLTQRIEKFQKTVQQGKEQLTAERDKLQQQQQEAEQIIAQAKSEKDKLDARAAALQESEEKLAHRKAQLKKAKESIDKRSEKIQDKEKRLESDSAQYAGLSKERQMLIEVKKFLEVSEAEMIQRWSTNKASSLVIGAVIAILMIAGFSFGIGKQLAAPKWQSDMAIEFSLPKEQADITTAQWHEQIRDIVLGETVLKETLSQLSQRNHRMFTNTAELSEHLNSNLIIEGDPGKLSLTYQTVNKNQGVPMLESIGRAIIGYQLAQDRINQRPDTARISRSATRQTNPVGDQSLKISAITFLSLVTLSLLAWVIMRAWLRKTQRCSASSRRLNWIH